MSAEDFSNQLQVSDSLTSHPAVVKLDSSLPSWNIDKNWGHFIRSFDDEFTLIMRTYLVIASSSVLYD